MKSFAALILLSFPLAASAVEKPSARGFFRSHDFIAVAPSGMDWSYKIAELAPEGSHVKKGDFVARFTPENLEKNLREDENQYAQRKIKSQDSVTTLDTDLAATNDLVGQSRRELALLEAANPANGAAPEYVPQRDILINSLDIEARRIGLKMLEEKLARKQALRELTVRTSTSSLALKEMRINQMKDELSKPAVVAKSDGTVLYNRNPRTQEKVKIGTTTWKGSEVVSIVNEKSLYVQAYPLETWFRDFSVGDRVDVHIMGSREVHTPGKVTKKDSIIMKVGSWDRSLPDSHPLFNAKAFRIEVELNDLPPEARPAGEVELTKVN